MMIGAPVHDIEGLDPPLTPAEFRRLAVLSARLPLTWTATSRRRRLLVVALAAPGFLLLWTTPLHRNLSVLAAGLVLFLAALLFRRVTEHVFVRAEAAELWPPSISSPKESGHA